MTLKLSSMATQLALLGDSKRRERRTRKASSDRCRGNCVS